MSKWISVKDRLPQDDRLQVCRYARGTGEHIGICLAHYYHPWQLPEGHRVWDFEFGSTQSTKITHWYPLPNRTEIEQVFLLSGEQDKEAE